MFIRKNRFHNSCAINRRIEEYRLTVHIRQTIKRLDVTLNEFFEQVIKWWLVNKETLQLRLSLDLVGGSRAHPHIWFGYERIACLFDQVQCVSQITYMPYSVTPNYTP